MEPYINPYYPPGQDKIDDIPIKEEEPSYEYLNKQFKKIVLLLRNAQDYSDHDEEIVGLISTWTGLDLPTPENYPEGKNLFK
jgi:hypothetical protein